MKGKGKSLAVMILEKAKGKEAEGSSEDDYNKAKEDVGRRMATAIKEEDGNAFVEALDDYLDMRA
jgi:hypothetical protein